MSFYDADTAEAAGEQAVFLPVPSGAGLGVMTLLLSAVFGVLGGVGSRFISKKV